MSKLYDFMMDFVKKMQESPLGSSFLFSLGQAGYVLKSKTGKLLGIDLYLSDYTEHDEGHVGFKRLLPKILGPKDVVFDYLIATHEHSDHYDYGSMAELMDNCHTELFSSVDCERPSISLGLDQKRIYYVKPGDRFEKDDFKLSFINCDHGTGSMDAVGVIVEMDGYRILEVGDTCLRLDRKDEYLSRGKIDILIAPINGVYGNLSEEECALLSKALAPGITIPCHYGMFASHFGSPGLFINKMKEICPDNQFAIMTQGEMMKL